MEWISYIMNNGYCFIVKPIFDKLFSLFFLVTLSPFIFLILFFLVLANKGNPIFSQERPGLHGKVFRLYKFRTMNNMTDSEGNLLPDKNRITIIGKIMRSLSLDEIPQLINVLKGDMSFIGPRPLLKKYITLYNNRQIKRHNVKSGITGWAQVNGRNSVSWTKKFEFDVWYVENISFLLDIRIIIKTLINIIKRKDINSSAGKTMPVFNGKN